MKTLYILFAVFIISVTTAKAQSTFETIFKEPKPKIEKRNAADRKPAYASVQSKTRIFQNYRPGTARSAAVAAQRRKTTTTKLASEAAPVKEAKPAAVKQEAVPTQGTDTTKP